MIFSFERQWKADHPYHGVSGGTYEYFNSMGFQELLKSIDKVDEHTVKFVLNEPEAPFIANMGMDFGSIMSAEYADQMTQAGTPEQVDLQPVGTGPFQFVAYQKDAVIRYQAHPDYWEGKAPLDNLIFAITPDASVRWQKLQAGECHVMPYPNPADLDAMRNHPDIEVLEQEGLNVGYLAFNNEKPPFDNVRVRQALNMAVNKEAIIEAVFQGAGTVAKNPIPPTIWSYNDAVEDYPYDPDQAKKILEEEGVTDLQTDLWAMPVQRPYNPNARRMAELIQADWANVGVSAEIVSFEWGEYLKRSLAGEHKTLLLGWTGDNGDPDNFLYVLLSCDAAKDGANRARWCHEPFDQAPDPGEAHQRTRRSAPGCTRRRRSSSRSRRPGSRSPTRSCSSRSARRSKASRSARSATTTSTASTSPAERPVGVRYVVTKGTAVRLSPFDLDACSLLSSARSRDPDTAPRIAPTGLASRLNTARRLCPAVRPRP